MLIDHGADVNCDSVSGFGTPLMAVCLPYSKYLEDADKLIQYLLKLGADVNAKSAYVGSPLAAAALSSRPNIVRVLIVKGARHDIKDYMKRRPIHFAALNGEGNFWIIQRAGGKVEAIDILGRSVLHYAAQGGRLRVIKRIFDLLPDLDVDIRDIDGWTPLCWAARGTTSWVPEDRASESTDPIGVVQYLLERGADRSVKCKIGDEVWKPLQLAHYTGAPDEVVALLEQERETDLQSDDAGKTTDDLNDLSKQKGKEIRGNFQQCRGCCDYVLCTKCWPHRDLVRRFTPPHKFEIIDSNSDHPRRCYIPDEVSDHDVHTVLSNALDSDEDDYDDVEDMMSMTDDKADEASDASESTVKPIKKA
ncbi:ankyrin repeat-containing domain protein [Xylaria venustula]|nr:ankyrin repeat-containing domain protein [Xylaria venustula]